MITLDSISVAPKDGSEALKCTTLMQREDATMGWQIFNFTDSFNKLSDPRTRSPPPGLSSDTHYSTSSLKPLPTATHLSTRACRDAVSHLCHSIMAFAAVPSNSNPKIARRRCRLAHASYRCAESRPITIVSAYTSGQWLRSGSGCSGHRD